MKPTTPHDPLDDLIAAALHGELTPQERTQFDSRLSSDPAAHAAYQKAQVMHDLLEKTHKNAQPDPDFERRMVSGVRRKLQNEQHPETAWESLLVLWTSVKRFMPRRHVTQYGVALAFVSVIGISALISTGTQVKSVFSTVSSQLVYAAPNDRFEARDSAQANLRSDLSEADKDSNGISKYDETPANKRESETRAKDQQSLADAKFDEPMTVMGRAGAAADAPTTPKHIFMQSNAKQLAAADQSNSEKVMDELQKKVSSKTETANNPNDRNAYASGSHGSGAIVSIPTAPALNAPATTTPAPMVITQNGDQISTAAVLESGMPQPVNKPTLTANAAPEQAPVIDSRKLIRNAQLDLEVKSFQAAMDQITALTKAAGGYVDTSNSQKGGNGKLQGTVVVKVLPQNLDGFLLKLRDLGQLRNQSVSTDDVTKDYVDTMARLDNSRKMEAQLQELLKRTNGKVAELLQVERELGRVRGEIEQMQGQLKLYDFQVQYATVTMNMRETDLNQTAAYLLKENDAFALFATDVEGAFQSTRKAADDFKAHVLSANLNHNSGSDVSATLVVSVPPEQIEPFLNQLRGMGRVANFTRETQRVPKDGGDTDQPADQTLTEKDKVIVNISIHSDDESRKQVAMTVVTATVDDALDKAKTTALANSGEILTSSLEKSPQGQSTGNLSVRVPGKNYHALLDAYKTLGRTASFSLQRDDNNGPGVNGDDEPVIITLALTDEEIPLQQTQMSVLTKDVDAQAQQLKKDAATDGVQVKASSFARQPNGMEMAQMVFRMPMSKYSSFVDDLKKLGDVESLTVNRVDRPDQARTDDTAPVEIRLRLHSRGNIVANDNGFMATLRKTFGEGAGALFGSIRVIGVLVAFAVPWVFAIGLAAWVGRRIYIWKKK